MTQKLGVPLFETQLLLQRRSYFKHHTCRANNYLFTYFKKYSTYLQNVILLKKFQHLFSTYSVPLRDTMDYLREN